MNNKILPRKPDFSLLQDFELMGFVAGDGCIQWDELKVDCRENELPAVVALLETCFGMSPNVKLRKCYGNATVPIHRASIYRTEIYGWAVEAGFWSGLDKAVPRQVSSASNEFKAAYLRGLFEADGCVNSRGDIRVAGASKPLMDGASSLLSDLGIDHGYSVCCSGHKKPLIQLLIRKKHQQKFMTEVGFLVPKKAERWMAVNQVCAV